MDPKATLRALLQACLDRDRREAQAHAQNFADWLKNRGALPSRTDIWDICETTEFTKPRKPKPPKPG